jgi:CRISPR-associated protein Csb2
VTAHRRHHPPTRGLTAVKFTIAGPTWPPITETVVYADLLRRAALASLGATETGRPATILGGKTADGTVLTDAKHAHYLPIADSDRLAGLLVWIPGSLPEHEVNALCAVQKLYGPNAAAITVRATNVGEIADVCPDLAKPHSTWRSVTPFVPIGYKKKNHDYSRYIAKEVARELRIRDMDDRCEIDILNEDAKSFRRYRPGKADRSGRPDNRQAYFLRLRFDEPVSGPITIGDQFHFGLGTFEPEQAQ